jgi:hypothetical protein
MNPIGCATYDSNENFKARPQLATKHTNGAKRAYFGLSLCSLVAALISTGPAHADPTFAVTPGEYYRVLEASKPDFQFANHRHSCSVDVEDNSYRCQDMLDQLVVVYSAPDKDSKLTGITIGAMPDDIPRAAKVATVAALSLDKKVAKLAPASDKMKKVVLSLVTDIEERLTQVYVRKGSDMKFTNDSLMLFMTNKNEDMVLVRVAPRS